MILMLSSEANSGASFIIDPKKLLNTTGVKRAKTQLSPTKAVIYEMSVPRLLCQEAAGFKEPSTIPSADRVSQARQT